MVYGFTHHFSSSIASEDLAWLVDTRSSGAPCNIFHVLRPLSSYPHGVMVIQLSMGSESLSSCVLNIVSSTTRPFVAHWHHGPI